VALFIRDDTQVAEARCQIQGARRQLLAYIECLPKARTGSVKPTTPPEIYASVVQARGGRQRPLLLVACQLQRPGGGPARFAPPAGRGAPQCRRSQRPHLPRAITGAPPGSGGPLPSIDRLGDTLQRL